MPSLPAVVLSFFTGLFSSWCSHGAPIPCSPNGPDPADKTAAYICTSCRQTYFSNQGFALGESFESCVAKGLDVAR